MILVRARYGGSALSFLLAGGNWNNGRNAGPGYRNANNTVSNSNRNNGTHVELRSRLSGPEQRTGRNPALGGRVEHTTGPQRSVSTRPVERSPLSAGLRWSA
jgi:hypothetical protein